MKVMKISKRVTELYIKQDRKFLTLEFLVDLCCTKLFTIFPEVVQRCSVKKVFLEVSQNSQENTCARDSLLTKRPWHRCFTVNFAKFLKTPFLTEHLRLLLLAFQSEFTLYIVLERLARNRRNI